jgi:hypothetical protein
MRGFAAVVGVIGGVLGAGAAGCGRPCDPSAAGAAMCAGASCPAESTRTRGECACAPGLRALHGACVSAAESEAYCGSSARWIGGQCAPRVCPEGHPVDAVGGACVPTRALRGIALRERIPLEEDQTLGCHDGSALISDGSHATCVPRATTCARGTRWAGAACAAARSCPVGAVVSGAGCEPLGIRGAAGDGYTVDVSRWALAVLGPDGGAGSAVLCRPLEQNPGALGIVPGTSGRLRITIELLFPNNDVTQVAARIDATEEAERVEPDPEGHPEHATAPATRAVPHEGSRLATAAVQSLTAALRALGGTSSAASLTRTVHCAIDGGTPPMAIPLPMPQHASSERAVPAVP